jgi:hypothetical protein
MKKICTWAVALLLMNSAFGQGNFQLGSNVIGVGLGFGTSYGYDYSGRSESPAISVQYEKGMWEVGGPGVISLGGYLGYKSVSAHDFAYDISASTTILGCRSAYHFNGIESDKFDVYGGLMLGLRFRNSSSEYSAFDYSDTDLILTLFVGGRYYFNSSWAGFVELGNGIGVLNIGAAYKF